MTLIEVLTRQVEATYTVTESLMKMVRPADLAWKPSAGSNWMTVAQLLRHCAEGCGGPIKGFVTGDWEMPDGVDMENIPPEQMLPPAEKLASVATVDEALQMLAQDRKTAIRYIAEAGESDLLIRKVAAPWGGPELTLFEQIEMMIVHLIQHKGQLFYYLKLMGRDVNTQHLWGM